MPIVVQIDQIMAKRKVSSAELAAAIQITPANLSRLKNGKAQGVRFSTLENICKVLKCTPGDILCYMTEEEYERETSLGTIE